MNHRVLINIGVNYCAFRLIARIERVLPYIGYKGYIGMCGAKGYGFLAVLV